MHSDQPPQVQSLRIRNTYPQPVTLHIEPWGDEVSMLPDAVYTIVIEGPGDDCLELDFRDRHVFAYGWPGSTVSVRHKEKIVCEYKIPAPR